MTPSDHIIEAERQALPWGQETKSSATADVGEPDDLREENRKLRKIAAFVPGKIYIEAKEKAGYGTRITALAHDSQPALAAANTLLRKVREEVQDWRTTNGGDHPARSMNAIAAILGIEPLAP